MLKSAINDLKKWLCDHMGSNYYYGEAPETAHAPYRVATLASSYTDGECEVWSLELDYWSNGKTEDAINEMIAADRGNGNIVTPSGMDKLRIDLNNGYVYIFYDGAQSVIDPDKRIRHKRASYYVRIYNKNGG